MTGIIHLFKKQQQLVLVYSNFISNFAFSRRGKDFLFLLTADTKLLWIVLFADNQWLCVHIFILIYVYVYLCTHTHTQSLWIYYVFFPSPQKSQDKADSSLAFQQLPHQESQWTVSFTLCLSSCTFKQKHKAWTPTSEHPACVTDRSAFILQRFKNLYKECFLKT